jgi:hypothetical protein
MNFPGLRAARPLFVQAARPPARVHQQQSEIHSEAGSTPAFFAAAGMAEQFHENISGAAD